WELGAGVAEPKPRAFRDSTKVFDLAVHGRRLAVAGEAGLFIWDLDTRKVIQQPTPVRAKPRAVAFTPDGRMLGSAGGTYLQVWDVATGAELSFKLGGHGAADIYQVAVGLIDPRRQEEFEDVPRALRIVTADVNGTARLWSLELPAATGADSRERT